MIIKPARMDKTGVEALCAFSEDPSTMGIDDDDAEQVYIPGISIPGIDALSTPFNVPIIGDNEGVSLAIDWPVQVGSPIWKRIAFTGMLVAEDTFRGVPPTDDTELEDLEVLEKANRPLNDAFDDFTGEWGGFLYAAVEIPDSVKDKNGQGIAEFVLFESEADFRTASSLLATGSVSAAEIVSFVRYPRLTASLGAQAISRNS